MSENVNITMNGTQPTSCYWNPTAEKIGKTFAYCLIFLVSLAGNTAVGIIVYKKKTMRKPINFFIVLIAVGRFGAVVYPLRSPLISSKLCSFFILASWIVAMAIHSPYLVALELIEYPGGLYCRWHWKEYFGEFSSIKKYYTSLSVLFAFIPFLVIAILYIIIFLKLKSQRKPGEQSANAGQQRQQRERNVLKMAIAIVLGFAVCWLPVVIAILLGYFAWPYPLIWPCGFQYFHSVALVISRANCAINPCLCFIFSRNYREGLKTIKINDF